MMATTAPSPARKSVISRQEILDAAAALFRQKGYYATTLRDIASGVGMKAGSVYYHFDSKEQILEAVLDIGIEDVFKDVRHKVEGMAKNASWRERFHVAMEAHLASLVQHGDYMSANVRVFSQAPEHIRNRHMKIRRAYEDYWADLYRRAQKAGAIRDGINLTALQALVFGAMNWTIEWYQPGREKIETLAEAYTDILMNGIQPAETG
ncbi:TetR family transcriptional regulator [Rhodospirillaceae bacterium AH-315-P19]|nr:TetR family transcriptional regulator [Rhodospirillaceae bacterium AH-315-P19]